MSRVFTILMYLFLDRSSLAYDEYHEMKVPEDMRFCVYEKKSTFLCTDDPVNLLNMQRVTAIVVNDEYDGIGVPQRIDGNEKEREAIREVLQLMEEYYYEEVLSKPEYEEIRPHCTYLHALLVSRDLTNSGTEVVYTGPTIMWNHCQRNDLIRFITLIYFFISQKVEASADLDTLLEAPSLARTNKKKMSADIHVVFSDVDGTLVHYPEGRNESTAEDDIIFLPPSATGMKGIISAQTLRLTQRIRQSGVKFVLVSGMRTSTLIKRLPYLPKADAYCSEAGGRIFYPASEGLKVVPVAYSGASPADLEAFCIAEDMDWRRQMESAGAAGRDGFIGNEIDAMDSESPVPLSHRAGALWTFARDLEDEGLKLDAKGYAVCFRVNRKQQSSESLVLFEKLRDGGIPTPTSLSSSTNLGCIDFYPVTSGKKNCCLYLASKLAKESTVASANCVCLCDDDNDIEMAQALAHAYIPAVSSDTMLQAVMSSPNQFTKCFTENILETAATEVALGFILDRIERS